MSSDNPSNNTNSSSPTNPSSRPKLTLNFSKSLTAEVSKKLEALKPKEKVVEVETKPKSQVQDDSKEQRQQKGQPQKTKPRPESQNNKTVDAKKQSNDDQATTGSTKMKAEANLTVIDERSKNPSKPSNVRVDSKKDKRPENKISSVENATVVNADANTEATESVETNNTKDKTTDEAKAKRKAELELKLALKNKKWLLKPEIYKKMIKEFRTDSPNCFTIPKRPLALTIRAELIAAKPEYSGTEIARFLHIYCIEKAYKQALILGAERVNLNGAVSSLVTEEQLAKDKSTKSS